MVKPYPPAIRTLAWLIALLFCLAFWAAVVRGIVGLWTMGAS